MTPTDHQENRRGAEISGARDPKLRNTAGSNRAEAREHHLDKTIEDSFPASDPTDPNPDGDE